jgi:hypothetical protein
VTHTDAKLAVKLINEFMAATMETVKAANWGTGRISKTKELRERKAARQLFHGLTGTWPTDDELAEILGY